MNTIFHWACQVNDCGFTHAQEISDDEFWDVAKEISEKGFNVMILTHESGNRTLAVDTKRFGQR